MKKEIEVKILEIDVAAVIARVKELGGAVRFDGDLDATYYDHLLLGVRGRGETLRVRLEGDTTVLTFKGAVDRSSGVKEATEIETRVTDAHALRAILAALGFTQLRHRRKHRVEYALGAAHIAIDTYTGEVAFVPPFLEIEAASAAEVHRIAALLGFPPEACRPWSGRDVEKHYRKISGK